MDFPEGSDMKAPGALDIPLGPFYFTIHETERRVMK